MKLKPVLLTILESRAISKPRQKLYDSAIDFFKKQLSISKNVNIVFKDAGKSNSFGHYDFKNKIVVDDASLIMTIQYLAHELTHVKQDEYGDLEVKNGMMLWKGEEILSKKDYDKNKDYNLHAKLPWEAEAYTNQKSLPQLYYKSKEFVEVMNSDPTLKYMLDNNLVP